MTLSTGTIGTLLFADDMVMTAETRESLYTAQCGGNECSTDQMGPKGKLEESKLIRVARKGEGQVIGD